LISPCLKTNTVLFNIFQIITRFPYFEGVREGIKPKKQTFSKNLKSGHPKCVTGPAQMNNEKNKTIFFDKWLFTRPQDAHLAKCLPGDPVLVTEVHCPWPMI